ncbi:MAG: hypothetical protein KKC18_04640 [Chloroflexi bacterium]|nr:hypothetical protein [Chloroflexota bacterium]
MHLYDLDFSSLQSLLAGWGEPTYRARQLWEWLYVHLATDLDRMANLPISLRERLAAEKPSACRRWWIRYSRQMGRRARTCSGWMTVRRSRWC